MPRDVETLTELARCLEGAGTPRGRLALLGRMAARMDWAISAVVTQIPAPERDWGDLARLLDVLDPNVARCLYDPSGRPR
jgi:hypothetical protein